MVFNWFLMGSYASQGVKFGVKWGVMLRRELNRELCASRRKLSQQSWQDDCIVPFYFHFYSHFYSLFYSLFYSHFYSPLSFVAFMSAKKGWWRIRLMQAFR